MLTEAVETILSAQKNSKKPLAIILAGHNGSGKSTMWRRRLADRFQMPLINADRMMMSILPEETGRPPRLPLWATQIRDRDKSWMHVAQHGVQAFVAHAILRKVPFAMETVFSEWRFVDGKRRSKIDLIRECRTPDILSFCFLWVFQALRSPKDAFSVELLKVDMELTAGKLFHASREHRKQSAWQLVRVMPLF
ncbi:MAG: hypothetical protein PHC52_08710 [Syntrophales bacterium]|nr:hypothetical protein [Syntrophales bacterium]MDD5532862.1 hypothetical protein [Syntrophales bacterium]